MATGAIVSLNKNLINIENKRCGLSFPPYGVTSTLQIIGDVAFLILNDVYRVNKVSLTGSGGYPAIKSRLPQQPRVVVNTVWKLSEQISGWVALNLYLRQIVNKTSKENLKPRKKNTNKVKFLQCNMQKSHHAQVDLNRRISTMNKRKEQFICCIQEPCSARSKLINQPNTVQRFGKSVCPRTCIYTDTNTNAWLLEALSTKDITAIQVCIQKQQVLIVSAYLDSADSIVWTRDMDKIVEYTDDKNLGLIICMDSNCHSTLFGPDTNARGKKFEEAIAGHNLVIENSGHVPTFHGGRARTCIDVTLTKRLHSTVSGWIVNTDYNGSDHNSIEFHVQQDYMIIPKVWVWHKADWPVFKESMKKVKYELPSNITNDTCEDMLKYFYKSIAKAMRKAIPRSKPKTVDRNNPWWSEELRSERRELNKAYKGMIKAPTQANTDRYKDKHRMYKRNCNTARLWSWRELQQNMGSISDMNMFRKIIQSSSKVSLGTLEKGNGEYTIPGEDTIEYLSQIHFTKATKLRTTEKRGRVVKRRQVLDWDESYLSKDKIKEAIDSFKSKKSPGTDGIHPLVLQQLPEEALEYLELLYRTCILLGYTPTKWKECKVVFIPKPGKSTYDAAKSWRPISLTNYLLKTLEKICSWHMDERLETHPVHKRQHGFRSDRNTETSLSDVVNYIEKYIYNGQHVIGVFLDIQAAFDTIDPEKVRLSLVEHGGNKDMVNWYYNYIRHRNLHIQIKGCNKILSTDTGFPQGGVCSAKFWIIAFNEAIEILNTHGVHGNGFADDCVALIGGENLDQMMSRMQKVVTKLETWGQKYGLVFNPGKTEVIIFSKAQRIERRAPNKLVVGAQTIDYTQQAKYLGVILDNKLLWSKHLDYATKRAKQFLFILKKAVSKKWGPKPKYMKGAYTAIVQARLFYGCIVWGPSLRAKGHREKIDNINRLAVAMLSNTRKSTPRLALEVMYNLPPNHLLVLREGLLSLARNRYVIYSNWKTKKKSQMFKGHIKYWEDKAVIYDLDLEGSDKTRCTIWDRNYKLNTGSFLTQGYPIQSQINIYTDGSKTDEHVGCGFVIYRGRTEISSSSIRLPEYCTVYQAEVMAIQLASEEALIKLKPNDMYIKLFSDSQAALKSLNKFRCLSKTVVRTVDALNELGRDRERLELNWIKAHNNYPGNERADELARNAAYHNIVNFSIDPPFSMIKSSLINKLNEEWNNEWAKEESCRMTKIFYPTVQKGKAKELCNLARDKSRRLIEIITGQNNLHYIQNKINGQANLCRLCEEEEETFDHFVNDCPCLWQARRDHFGVHRIINTHDWKIDTLIRFSELQTINEALESS